MATLEGKQKAEREVLERLLDNMERSAHDLNTLMDVLAACKHIAGVDPLPHIKAAMRHYLEQSNGTQIINRHITT
jgi:hypothetical protein